MANNELQIRLVVKDELSKALKSAEKNTKKSSKNMVASFAKLAAGVYLAQRAFQVLGRGIGAIIGAANAQEIAVNQLNTVLKSTGYIAGITSEEVQKMAKSFQDTTTFGDEVVLAGQSLLLTFTKIGKDIFPQATETMLDMSVALGQDLKSSAIQLGKALNDPILGMTALRRVGVNFSSAQVEMVKGMVAAGDVMGAQKFILEELGNEFGGSATAAVNTFAGAMDQMKNKYSDFLEEVGKFVTQSDSAQESVEKTGNFFADMGDKVNALREATNGLNFGDWLLAIAGAEPMLNELLDPMGRLEKKMRGISVNSVQAANAFGQVKEKLQELNIETTLATAVNIEDSKARIESLTNINKLHMDKIKMMQEEDKLIIKLTKDTQKKDKVSLEGMMQYFGALQSALNSAAAEDEKYAKAAQAVNLGMAIMNTAVGISKAFADYTYPLSLVIAGLVAAAGAIQISTIASQGFAEGTDTVPAMLSPGEMVVPRSFADAVRSGDITIGGRGNDAGVNTGDINIYISNPIVQDDEGIDSLGEELGFRIEEALRTGRG